MEISAAFPPSPHTPAHIAVAERLGYRRAWCYDAPHVYADVWTVLALAAQRTDRIGLGPGVLVPSLRHPMANAAATATLAALAPGRVAVAFGTGFGRFALGQRPLTWSYVAGYIRAFRGLLRGETVEWDGAPIRMLHGPGLVPDRPIDVPVLISAAGPTGWRVAHELGADGLWVAGELPEDVATFSWVPFGVSGTVFDEQSHDSERIRAAAGPAAMLAYHGAFAFAGRAAVERLPGGQQWLAVIDGHPERERHLAVHEGHLTRLNAADRAAWDAGGHVLVHRTGFTGPPGTVRASIKRLLERGVTEVVFQPAGPDLVGELERFAAAVAA